MKRSPLKRGNKPLKRYTPLRKKKPGKASEPHSSIYLRWIRTLPCAVCDGRKGPSQAAHTHQLGPKGLGEKTTAKSAIPLCAHCHVFGGDSYHRLTPEWRWADYHGLDLRALVQRLNNAWQLMRGTR